VENCPEAVGRAVYSLWKTDVHNLWITLWPA
jgi:hypothetical protein